MGRTAVRGADAPDSGGCSVGGNAEALPSRSDITPNLAPQSCIAFASIASNTGSSSPEEIEMTCSTADVAVCCSSASRSSFEQSRVLDSDDGLLGKIL